jgi:hypothetical protein
MVEEETSESTRFLKWGERLSELFEVDKDAAINAVQGEAPEARPLEIQVVPVHTFILQGISKDVNLTPGLSKGILVPSFASHWGVVTGEPGARTLYHLIFNPDVRMPGDGKSAPLRGKRRAVEFHHTQWPPSSGRYRGNDTTTKVGDTTYSHQDMIKIGTTVLIIVPCHMFTIFTIFFRDWLI